MPIDLAKLEELCKESPPYVFMYVESEEAKQKVASLYLAARKALPELIAQLRAQDKALKLAEEALLTAQAYAKKGQRELAKVHQGRGENPEACSACVIIANRLDEMGEALAVIREARRG